MVKRLQCFLFLLAISFFSISAVCAGNSHLFLETDRNASEMRPLLERFAVDRADLEWVYDTPMSKKGLDRRKQFFETWLGELEKISFESLNQDGRIEYLLFENVLTYELQKIDLEIERNRRISPWIPFWKIIVELEENRAKMTKIDAKQAAIQLNTISNQIFRIKNEIKDRNKVDKTAAYCAVQIVDNLKNVLRRWFHFYNGYDPLFTWWNEQPYRKTDKALKDYADFLGKEILGIKKGESSDVIIADPIGRRALMVELQHEMISYSPEELIEAGKREYAWCEAEMIKASKELGFGEDWHKAVEHVKLQHVSPGVQPYLIKDQAWEAIEFLEKHDLITVPPLAKETWKIGMMSPERQKVNPFFTGGRVISVSFPTNTMSHELKMMSMKGNNIHFSRATVHHELIPGHHLQFFMNSRYKTYREVFATPFWLEGWPLHWEMLLWDLGFAQSPENKVGMLFWRMHRCARIIYTLSFQLGTMTPEQCVGMLLDIGHEISGATAEVRRSIDGSYPPLYHCAYMVGGLQIRMLYHELVINGKWSNRSFHDAVLKENSMPIVMLRAKLKNVPLSKDSTLDWKFLDNDPN